MFLRSHSRLWGIDRCKSQGGHHGLIYYDKGVLKRQRVQSPILLKFPFSSASHFTEYLTAASA